jgi:NlpC/P60 family putative phage cell wall peptidase
VHKAQDVIEKAREWINTPYRNQGRTKGVETDCVGILIGVGQDLGFDTAHEPKDYGQIPNPKKLLARIRQFCEFKSFDVEDARPGDILLITWREQPGGLPHHTAVRAEWNGRPTMIHAHSIAGKCVEHGLTPDWKKRVRSVWRVLNQED